MLRLRNWILPLLALALAIGFTAVRATAEEAKKETGTVSGVVQDKDGKPVAGAEVGIFHATGKHAAADKPKTEAKNPAEKPEKANSVVPMVKSDDKGEFTLSDVPVGDYTVRAKLKGQGTAHNNVSVKAGETAKVTLKLEYHSKNAPSSGEKPTDAAK
jgi:protocatechuate 3,4-dioxygenase beta subunit